MGRNWGDFGPRPPWGGWVAGGWPQGRASVPGEVVWWFGWPFGDLDGLSPVILIPCCGARVAGGATCSTTSDGAAPNGPAAPFPLARVEEWADPRSRGPLRLSALGWFMELKGRAFGGGRIARVWRAGLDPGLKWRAGLHTGFAVPGHLATRPAPETQWRDVAAWTPVCCAQLRSGAGAGSRGATAL